jgi:uncharacterized membrane protein
MGTFMGILILAALRLRVGMAMIMVAVIVTMMVTVIMLIFAKGHLEAVRVIAMTDTEHCLEFMRLRNEGRFKP